MASSTSVRRPVRPRLSRPRLGAGGFTIGLGLATLLGAGSALAAEGPEDSLATPAYVSDSPVVIAADPVGDAFNAQAWSPVPGVAADAPTEDYGPDPYLYNEPAAPAAASEPEPRTSLKLSSGYFGLGIAPGMTIHPKGFHPNTRFELEFGGTLEHRYRDLALSFGVVTHLTPYYERKTPSFGADVISTIVLGPIYVRTGLGAVGGLPRLHMLHQTVAGLGGVVGVGLSLGREPVVRIGVDYDLRVNTKLEPVQTFLLALRLACCRKS